VYVVGTAIATLTPTTTNSPTSFTVTPALPAGLTISAATGTISGTPTAAAAQANYTVTASNGGSSGNTTVAIRVNDIAPEIDYARSAYNFTMGSAANVSPTSAGGVVVTWSVSPALPAGLALSPTTGAISGTPTALAATTNYVITATNTGGTDTFSLDITVSDGVLLNLGNRNANGGVAMLGNRILISDNVGEVDGDWTLWDAENATVIKQYHARYCVWVCGPHQAMAGNTMVSRGESEFVVRSSVDGSLISTIPSSTNDISWWRLSADGNYIAAGDETNLRIWSSAGATLVAKVGNYKAALPFLDTDSLRIANGPSGASVIESYALPSGAMTVSAPFNGTFRSWFVDGQRFITTLSTAVYIYSKSVVQLDLAAPPSFNEIGGYGDFYWTRATYIRVYDVGNGGATVSTFMNASRVLPAENMITIPGSPSTPLWFVDLSGAAPVEVQVTPPAGASTLWGTPDGANWVYSDGTAIVRRAASGGSPARQYGLGRVLGIAGANDRVAVATIDGKLRVFDTSTRALLTTLDAPTDPKLAMTADGATLLVMARSDTDRSLRFYSLPAGNLLAEWPYTGGINGQAYLSNFTLARGVDRVALELITYGTNQSANEVRRFDGTVEYSSNSISFINLSPSATRFANSTGYRTLSPATLLYSGTTLAAAANGYATGWLDENRILVSFYKRGGSLSAPNEFDNTKIIDASGNLVANTTLPEMDDFQVVSTSSIYSRIYNQILDVNSGAALWSGSAGNFNGPYPSRFWHQGAVTGNFVVFDALDAPVVRVETR
jgi:hypothetical protein